jgi:hypothetical protein
MGERIISRDQFGPGDAGKTAYEIMRTNPVCQECAEVPAELVLNFDVLGEVESVPLCRGCVPLVKEKVEADFATVGRLNDGTFGFNGLGRC